MAVGLLLLAVLIAPLMAVAAQDRGGAPSGRCDHPAAVAAAAVDILAAFEVVAVQTAGGHACPDAGGMVGTGDGCAAIGCHGPHIGLPLGDASPPVPSSPAPVAVPMTALLDGVGVEPAPEPPRAFL